MTTPSRQMLSSNIYFDYAVFPTRVIKRRRFCAWLHMMKTSQYSAQYNMNRPRAPAYSSYSPFPFLNLPSELRNEVYRLVSSSTDWLYCGGPKTSMKGHTEGIPCYDSLQNVKAHSSLYRTCKQIRDEGLALFFQHHCFLFYVEHGGCFLAILLWLRNIAEVGRNNIRHLRIRYWNTCCPQDVLYMDILHGMLSEQANVAYVPEDAESLWRLGRSFSRIFGKAPPFRIDGWTSEHAPFKIEYTDYTHGLNWHRLMPRRFSLAFSLVFYPGQSWFRSSVDL